MEVDMNLVNQFLSREDLNETEQQIKDKIINLEHSYNVSLKELQEKETEFNTLKHRFEAMIVLAYELEVSRQGLEGENNGS